MLQVRVFNYNTLERVHAFDAHSDYVRAIAVHPTQPFILTSSGKCVCVWCLVREGSETVSRGKVCRKRRLADMASVRVSASGDAR